MELGECTRIVFSRIQTIESDDSILPKIIAYLLWNHSKQEIVEYALGPDKQIVSLINKAKAFLSSSVKTSFHSPAQTLVDQKLQFVSIPHAGPRPLYSPSSFQVTASFREPQLSPDQVPPAQGLELHPALRGDMNGGLESQVEFPMLEDQLNHFNHLGARFASHCYYPDARVSLEVGSMANMGLHSVLPESLTKPCYYYYKGYCKHGFNCRFFHGDGNPEDRYDLNDVVNEDHDCAPGSLEMLEMEIKELLKSRRGVPISIAALPMLYQDKFGKVLQANGYLTESQRHGKAGFSLTKLLAKLKNSIRLIDRPHGQHAVVLTEDAAKSFEYGPERIDRSVLATSHQIYLTFPADSTFNEEDVFDHFRQFGPVRDVRIPRQEKRMFGFVSFFYPETVKIILSMSHPHYICGARVLVKTYKEKSKVTKKQLDKVKSPIYHASECLEFDQYPHTVFPIFDNPGHLRRQLIEDHELAYSLGKMQLELQLSHRQLLPQHCLNNETDEVKSSEVIDDHNIADAPSNGLKIHNLVRQTSINNNDLQCDNIELPDSPFADIGFEIDSTK